MSLEAKGLRAKRCTSCLGGCRGVWVCGYEVNATGRCDAMQCDETDDCEHCDLFKRVVGVRRVRVP